ncbi:MAG: DUF420 domain-containing protein [Phycisphaeraceae bacterium]|nr:DUF420 domain-containing protein [Phycisphaeraceae bacterium]
MDLSFLPAVNASLNALAAALLVTGYVLIRQRRIDAHRRCMIAAFAVSMAFLVCYLLHKAWKRAAGLPMHTDYHAEGFARTIYLVILLSHLLLAMAVPVLAMAMIYLGWKRRDARHRRLGRIALPIWLYVSITGVVIYFMLYHANGG